MCKDYEIWKCINDELSPQKLSNFQALASSNCHLLCEREICGGEPLLELT